MGHEIFFASVRPIRDLLPVLPEALQTFPMVGGNGAFVANAGEMIAVTAFQTENNEMSTVALHNALWLIHIAQSKIFRKTK